MKRETVFSGCRKYRYTLWREWGLGHGPNLFPSDNFSPPFSSRLVEYVQFIGLNPSTADETNDDPTIRRCIAFAKAWGYGALCMTNIFAWRDTDPEKMKAQPSPIGEPYNALNVVTRPNGGTNVFDTWNDYWLATIADGAAVTVAAWGKHGAHMGRAEQVKKLIPSLQCLSFNKDRSPEHPLYLKKTLTPIPFA